MTDRSSTAVADAPADSLGSLQEPVPPTAIDIRGMTVGRSRIKREATDYSKGEMVFGMGDPATGIYVVNAGRIKIYRLWEDGREITLGIVGKGDIFGEEALVSREGFTTFAETLERSSIVFLKREDVLAQIANKPSLATALMQITGERLIAAQRQVENLAFRRVTSRVADLLINLAEYEAVDRSSEIVIRPQLTHQQMASLVGTTRETFTSTISKLVHLNIIRSKRRTLYILDLAALRQFC